MNPVRDLEDRLYEWLGCADAPGNADLLFVLAGREDRKAFALELFRTRNAPKLLLSVARFEIRRLPRLPLPAPIDLLSIAAEVPPPDRHYFVLFEGSGCEVERIPVGRLGTLSEIAALADWLRRRPDVRSIRVISSKSHLRRVRMCCRALLPLGVQLQLSGTTPGAEHSLGTKDRGSVTEISKELFKLVLYRVVVELRRASPRQS